MPRKVVSRKCCRMYGTTPLGAKVAVSMRSAIKRKRPNETYHSIGFEPDRRAVLLWQWSKQPDSQGDDRRGKSDDAEIDEQHEAVRVRGCWRGHRKKESGRNQKRCKRHSCAGDPHERSGKVSRIGKDLAEQRQDHEDASMGVSGTKEVLAQSVVHVVTVAVDQR